MMNLKQAYKKLGVRNVIFNIRTLKMNAPDQVSKLLGDESETITDPMAFE